MGMELNASGDNSNIRFGGDGANGNISKSVTNNHQHIDYQQLISKLTIIEGRLTRLENNDRKRGVEDMINKRFVIIVILLFVGSVSFFPTISMYRPKPTAASFAVSPFYDYSDFSNTPSIQPPTVQKIKEWCLGQAYTIEENEELIVDISNGGTEPVIRCTESESIFRDWLSDVGAQDAPILTYIINEGGTPEMTQNPILGVAFDCSGYNYGCSVLYFHTYSSNLNQNFVAAPLSNNWRNRISSYQKWLWHNAIHYDNNNLTGASITCTCSNMGAMDNNAESILFISSP